MGLRGGLLAKNPDIQATQGPTEPGGGLPVSLVRPSDSRTELQAKPSPQSLCRGADLRAPCPHRSLRRSREARPRPRCAPPQPLFWAGSLPPTPAAPVPVPIPVFELPGVEAPGGWARELVGGRRGRARHESGTRRAGAPPRAAAVRPPICPPVRPSARDAEEVMCWGAAAPPARAVMSPPPGGERVGRGRRPPATTAAVPPSAGWAGLPPCL